MRKKIAAMMMAALAVLQAPAAAAMPDNYASVSQALGDGVSNYIYQTEAKGKDINYIVKGGSYGATYTGTNVRSQPSPDVPTVATIEGGKVCQILGYAENGWIRVLCKGSSNGDVVGWIREDLLNPAEPPAQEDYVQDETAVPETETAGTESGQESVEETADSQPLLVPSSEENTPETQPLTETEQAVEIENSGMQSMLYLG